MELGGMYDTGISVREAAYHVSTATTVGGPRWPSITFASTIASRLSWSPILRNLLQHCIQVRRIEDDLAGRVGSFPQNAGQNDDWLTCDSVMKPGDYGLVAREILAGILPLKRPGSLGKTPAIHDLAYVVVKFESNRQVLCDAHRPGIVKAPIMTDGPPAIEQSPCQKRP
jgi:hypothetical protein